MKKVALLTISLLIAAQAYAQSETAAHTRGVVKLAGSAALGVCSLFTLKQSWTNFQASRQIPAGWSTYMRDHLLPGYKNDYRTLAQYQLGTTGFAALLAKQLYDSGMKDFKQNQI